MEGLVSWKKLCFQFVVSSLWKYNSNWARWSRRNSINHFLIWCWWALHILVFLPSKVHKANTAAGTCWQTFKINIFLNMTQAFQCAWTNAVFISVIKNGISTFILKCHKFKHIKNIWSEFYVKGLEHEKCAFWFIELCNKSKEEGMILHAILILQARIHRPSLFVEMNAVPQCLDTQICGYQPVHYGNPLLCNGTDQGCTRLCQMLERLQILWESLQLQPSSSRTSVVVDQSWSDPFGGPQRLSHTGQRYPNCS